jgi:hypothetical protein
VAICDGAHRALDPLADGEVQVGPLPSWTRVQGRVAWYVHAGPYSEMGRAWETFHRKVAAVRPGVPDGPPGDVYACRPEDHEADHGRQILTILYVPLA